MDARPPHEVAALHTRALSAPSTGTQHTPSPPPTPAARMGILLAAAAFSFSDAPAHSPAHEASEICDSDLPSLHPNSPRSASSDHDEGDLSDIGDVCSASPGARGSLKRRRATPDATRVLNAVLEQTFFPDTELRQTLARQLKMTPRKVQIWFQNRRQALGVTKRHLQDQSFAASAKERVARRVAKSPVSHRVTLVMHPPHPHPHPHPHYAPSASASALSSSRPEMWAHEPHALQLPHAPITATSQHPTSALTPTATPSPPPTMGLPSWFSPTSSMYTGPKYADAPLPPLAPASALHPAPSSLPYPTPSNLWFPIDNSSSALHPQSHRDAGVGVGVGAGRERLPGIQALFPELRREGVAA
ncbi:hypothetical protein M427DRAFT_70574 [Gonapodya prolifera JEL478]|uniref:Homeobox domain-containing protein n=1 Tax=Gonapodya prolifera (strain JEL478) TaxID=1344416 RepID=A0A139ACV8_GONPJ|nr:hypothetical protein M427DRAFT_70574 [Gonapodya prolifera JEL478]|eukprot:KXS14578.1 hypothetical protein M427DRAFT_70574 [Gonapodya prolifera JEL478]